MFRWVDKRLDSAFKNAFPELSGSIYEPNKKWKPPGNLWLKIEHAHIIEQPATLGIYGMNELEGFTQISVYTRIGSGVDDAKSIIDNFADKFRIPSRLNTDQDCLLRLTNKRFDVGMTNDMRDVNGGTEKTIWYPQYLTYYWLAREPRKEN